METERNRSESQSLQTLGLTFVLLGFHIYNYILLKENSSFDLQMDKHKFYKIGQFFHWIGLIFQTVKEQTVTALTTLANLTNLSVFLKNHSHFLAITLQA